MSGLVLGVRFLLELALLYGLALGGWSVGGATATRVVVAIVAPAAAAAIWGSWIAPKAARRLADPARLLLEAGLFAIGTGAFVLAARPGLALGFAVVAVAHLIAMLALDMRGA